MCCVVIFNIVAAVNVCPDETTKPFFFILQIFNLFKTFGLMLGCRIYNRVLPLYKNSRSLWYVLIKLAYVCMYLGSSCILGWFELGSLYSGFLPRGPWTHPGTWSTMNTTHIGTKIKYILKICKKKIHSSNTYYYNMLFKYDNAKCVNTENLIFLFFIIACFPLLEKLTIFYPIGIFFYLV